MTIINAFHPLFVQTHMPQFLTAVKTDDRQSQAGATLSKHVTEKRKTVPSHGQVTGVSKVQRETIPNQKFQDIAAFPKTRETQLSLRRGAKMTVAEVAQELTAAQKAKLAPREFHTFSKAGTANTTKEKKK
jgi:hypothetical protein